ncbi:uncharacterized protein DUF4367 [Anaerobacterium chartisolvens]|uniref:Uncharacterized protein DUF4367 n=1 Tax=Anaerobacterium chartisolvens TaxID=1297424 RepID=A0A369B7G3_9FIRM|nr:DUF4367 domain-containing protein [Anaerobacterium chartisolvens]RCX17460.1 uncharacterized protein DUF4367 [Anaerobacterium chartisolvens]
MGKFRTEESVLYGTEVDTGAVSEYGRDRELLELSGILAGKDFSKCSNKQGIYRKVQENINGSRGERVMKNSNRIRRVATVAVSFTLVFAVSISLMQTTFAQNVLEGIKKSISLGHITVIQFDADKIGPDAIPEELKDDNGKLLQEYEDSMYMIVSEDGTDVSAGQTEKMRKESILEIKNADELNEYTCFKVILPGYLPEGYKFYKAELYKDENGAVSGKYVSLYFTNEATGKRIFMQQRFADEETAYENGTGGEFEQVEINGVAAVISNDRTIEWESGDVLYMMTWTEDDKGELIKIAESIK